ncbi:MFS transporter [Tropicimonas aquimaris]|uniref:CynX/NimT family MFS transporter n=1 Tax=Tropicimonas aquimaris TaxID=914152 RepID=A0ABW3IJT4_9RHOB
MQLWIALAALTLARAAMGVQFQSVPALATSIVDQTGIGFGAIGVITGIYLLPGAITALFGGWAGQALGDLRTALAGLVLMVVGGISGALFLSFEAQLAARFFAGTGAVALNVMVTKMVGDMFQGRRDLPVAMGILVSSWPAGLALAMLFLPVLATYVDLRLVLALPAGLSLIALILMVATWSDQARSRPTGLVGLQKRLLPSELKLVCLAGIIWGFYNTAFIAAMSWAPGHLQAGGLSHVDASGIVSITGWVAVLSVAAGGWLATRLRQPDLAATACFGLSAIGLVAFVLLDSPAASFSLLVLLGLVVGPAAAMVMTLPVEATRPDVRAIGMGIYMAIYYALMGMGPSVFGALRESLGLSAPLFAAAGTMATCLMLWLIFRRFQSSLNP